MQRIQTRMAQREQAQYAVPNRNPTRCPPTPAMAQLLQQLGQQISPAKATKLQWIQASVRNSIQMIPVEDVLFFISDEKYTRVQTASVEALIRKPIKELIEELDMQQFWQIHRSTFGQRQGHQRRESR